MVKLSFLTLHNTAMLSAGGNFFAYQQVALLRTGGLVYIGKGLGLLNTAFSIFPIFRETFTLECHRLGDSCHSSHYYERTRFTNW